MGLFVNPSDSIDDSYCLVLADD